MISSLRQEVLEEISSFLKGSDVTEFRRRGPFFRRTVNDNYVLASEVVEVREEEEEKRRLAKRCRPNLRALLAQNNPLTCDSVFDMPAAYGRRRVLRQYVRRVGKPHDLVNRCACFGCPRGRRKCHHCGSQNGQKSIRKGKGKRRSGDVDTDVDFLAWEATLRRAHRNRY